MKKPSATLNSPPELRLLSLWLYSHEKASENHCALEFLGKEWDRRANGANDTEFTN